MLSGKSKGSVHALLGLKTIVSQQERLRSGQGQGRCYSDSGGGKARGGGGATLSLLRKACDPGLLGKTGKEE